MIKFSRKSRTSKIQGEGSRHNSITTKDITAKLAPKKIIRARYDYAPPDSDGYLSFTKGEFLSVIGRENDDSWYEVYNENGKRGLVPARYFEDVPKTATRDSRDSNTFPAKLTVSHDSGIQGIEPEKPPAKPHIAVKLLYNFKAERSDELEASEGDVLIAEAQSDPEWFLCKTTFGGGGPGLVPSSYVEIWDKQGVPVPDADRAEFIRQVGLRTIEKWKEDAQRLKDGAIDLRKVTPSQPAYPVKASVPQYYFAEDIFWFIVECQMSDGSYWALSRVYQDFYDLQILLIQSFPVEAGAIEGTIRTLPYMPGPVTYVTDAISKGRRGTLNEYIEKLLELGLHIANSVHVRNFFKPRESDYEIDPNVDAGNNFRDSNASFPSYRGASQDMTPQGNLPPDQHYTESSTMLNHPTIGTSQPYNGHSSFSTPAFQPQSSTLTQNSSQSAQSTTKIKVWFSEENCVIIRMPANFNYNDLYKKLIERRNMEEPHHNGRALVVEYRDEMENQYFTLTDDQDLEIAMERNPKLTLVVR
ncbi:hypothetical protein M501DRAFT_990477 [Patellaria atrata CBS 101060]|uniref:Uncharacterized protein n=1 Tax=Patellaria atrata CBS 101060 TaxID=1346257 RepID=A0A9P4S0N9_9PEZI|nr:hypothetical protein M501DRAFT_990477 [Patellaria atrata CBS 101060]